MNYIEVLKADLEKGYSKADLERLIGLPKNNLSGILKGDRKLSKKSELKIEKWETSEKPNPLESWIKEFNDMAPVTSEHEFFQSNPNGTVSAVSSGVAGEAVTVTLKAENLNSGYRTIDIEARIKTLEQELKNPPKTAVIGLSNWIRARQTELAQLKEKLNQV